MKKILGVLSIFVGLELLICFISCFFIPVPVSVAKSYIFGYRILTGVELFIKYFPAVAITGYIVSFSVYFGRNCEGSLTRFSPQMMVRFRLVMISTIIIASCLTLNTEVFGNIVYAQKRHIESQQKIINEYIKVGSNLFKNGYYDRAARYADAALELNQYSGAAAMLKDNAEVEINRRQNSDIRKKLYNAVEEADKVERVDIDPEQISQVYDYYLKAVDEYKKGNWIDAHYYAEIGLELASAKDPNIDALREISTDAWNQLSEAHKMSKTKDQELFDKKYEGYLALIEHDDLKAYYIFRELYQSSREMQSDPDVVFYMEIAEDRINQKSFFIDETLELESFESSNDVYFSYEYPDGSVDIFYCKGITIVEETGKSIQYLRDLTIVSIDREGNWFRTMTVPYAKVSPVAADKLSPSTREYIGINDDIENLPYFLLKSVSRDIPGSEIVPQYVYSNGEKATSPEYLLFPMDYDEFIMLESSTHNPENIPIFTLYKLAFNADEYGYSREVFAQVLMNRIYFPLLIIILFVMFATFAWHNRIDPEGYFKLTWALAFPLFFIVSIYFYKGALFVFKLLNYAILGRMSVGPALIAGGVVYIIIFIIVSVVFLGSRSRK